MVRNQVTRSAACSDALPPSLKSPTPVRLLPLSSAFTSSTYCALKDTSSTHTHIHSLSLTHTMKFVAPVIALAAGISTVVGQAATDSICDRYTTALLKNNTAENQATVLTLVVNTALIGNYTNPAGPAMNAVTGILNNGTYMGTDVSLLKVSGSET